MADNVVEAAAASPGQTTVASIGVPTYEAMLAAVASGRVGAVDSTAASAEQPDAPAIVQSAAPNSIHPAAGGALQSVALGSVQVAAASASGKTLIAYQAELLRTGQYSDVTIKCGNKTWNCHLAIILPRSKVLERIYDTGSDAGAEGYNTDVMILPDEDDPELVWVMLFYLYTQEIPLQETTLQADAAVKRCLDLMALSHKYKIDGLHRAACTQLQRLFEHLFFGGVCVHYIGTCTCVKYISMLYAHRAPGREGVKSFVLGFLTQGTFNLVDLIGGIDLLVQSEEFRLDLRDMVQLKKTALVRF